MEAMMPRPTHRQLAGTALLLVCLVGGLIAQRAMVAKAAGEIAGIPASSAALLLLVIVIHRLLQSALVATVTCSPAIDRNMHRALLVNEAHTGCSNALLGGGAVGTGVKTAMLKSWGVDGHVIATSITASSVVPMIMQWMVTAAAAGFFIAAGDRSLPNQLALGAGLGLSIGPIIFWAILLTRPRAVKWIAVRFARVPLLLAKVPFLPTRTCSALRQLDLPESAERIRVNALPLLGRRGAVALFLGLLSQLAVGVILITALHGLQATVGVALHPVQAMAALALARTLGSFGPLPAGMGVLDAGLLASLTAQGVARPSALAVIGVYRAATFVVPIVTGLVAIAAWRVSLRNSPAWNTTARNTTAEISEESSTAGQLHASAGGLTSPTNGRALPELPSALLA
jgi:uncharacterized membrane protein YbhN (UPF0104 family)